MNKVMKKLIILSLLLVILLTSCTPLNILEEYSNALDALNSTDIFVIDITSGFEFYHSDDGNNIVYPASITKLLSALVALDTLPADTVITPGDEVYMIGQYSSVAYIRPNHKLTVEMLVEAMLIPSGNDAAYALAAACGQKISGNSSISPAEAINVFVAEMNKYATELGCTGTNFTCPDGYAGNEHYSTVSDIAKIAKAAIQNDIIRKYVGTVVANVVYASGHTNTWKNTNLQMHKESEFYNPHVKGMKTGSLTDNNSLVTYYNDGETELLIGTFGSPTKEGRYEDTREIIDYFTKINQIKNAR